MVNHEAGVGGEDITPSSEGHDSVSAGAANAGARLRNFCTPGCNTVTPKFVCVLQAPETHWREFFLHNSAIMEEG